MKILVTGGTGFIGRHVVAELLHRNFGVRVLARSAPGPKPDARIEHVRHDIREATGLARAVEGVDAVIHCSAAMDGDLPTQLAITVEGTENLLNAMKQARVRRIIGISTFAIYDYLQIPAGALLTEDSPLEENFDARAPYIRAKRYQEDLIREHAAANGWRSTILRPGLVYGKDRTWFYHLGTHLGARRWLCLAGEGLLPITHVENCASAIVAALECDAASGQTANIVDDDLPTRRTYAEELAKRTKPAPSITTISWPALERAARSASWMNRTILRGKAPVPGLLDPASLAARCKPLQYSNQRAKEALGWKPKWNLQEGLDRSF